MLIGVDVGGTFTDVVAISDGKVRSVKISTDVQSTERSVAQGAREMNVGEATIFNHASTHGLNAIITRRLPKIACLTTEGHRDILDGGRTIRPTTALTDPHWRRSFGDAARPLIPRYLRRGVRERIAADGSIFIPLDEQQVRSQLQVLRKCAVQGIAICLLNAYVNRQHEERLRDIVREELGDIPCSISCDVSPLAKEYARASTTVVDVFMKIIYGQYTENLKNELRDLGFKGQLNYANCAAHLLSAEVAMQRPFEIVFAGPAAGTLASAHFGKLIGAGNLLCADVGGTSCDISLIADFKPFVNTTFELEHDLVVNALSIELASIGAGGGSLVTISPAGELHVGPGSAGSDPGPCCYGKGGREPTLTDACLLMGVIDSESFAGGRLKLDKTKSLDAFEQLDTTIPLERRVSYAFNVGINNIAEGVTNIAIQHGVDPREYSLVAFGAAGPMLLPAVLNQVHCSEVIIPPNPGLFSALGLLSSEQTYSASRSAYTMVTPGAADGIEQVFQEMEADMRERIRDQCPSPVFTRAFDGRLVGQSWETPFVPIPPGRITADAVQAMIANFHTTYELRSGNRFASLPVQSVTFRIETVIPTSKVEYAKISKRAERETLSSRKIEIWYLTDEPVTADEYQRTDLRRGDIICGPAIIREASSTTFVLMKQKAIVGDYGELHITQTVS